MSQSGTRIQCVILAGGLGTRMFPMTETIPKSLLPVAGKPFIDWQLAWLASEGVTDVILSIGHLGQAIREHVGDGSRWSLRVAYVDEGEHLLGTGGALRLACTLRMLDPAFAVLYGDSYLRVPVASAWDRFVQSGAPALMTVLRNQDQWDRSNIIYEDGRVLLYDKNVRGPKSPSMVYVDYGMSILTRDLIERNIPENQPSDLAQLLSMVSRQGLLAGYEVFERFYEIGSPEGLRDLETYLAAREPAQ